MATLKFPNIYLIHNEYLRDKELLALERQIGDALCYDIREAEIILGKKVYREGRAKREIERCGVVTLDVPARERLGKSAKSSKGKGNEATDAIVLDSSTESDEEPPRKRLKSSSPAVRSQEISDGETVKFLSVEWYLNSVKENRHLPVEKYLVWEGRLGERPKLAPARSPVFRPPPRPRKRINGTDDRTRTPSPGHSHEHGKHGSQNDSQRRPALLHETTSEHDIRANLPPLPSYLDKTAKDGKHRFSCHWPVPLHGHNEDFISILKQIEKKRVLTKDDKKISANSYLKSMAAIAAYPYTITTEYEVERLPGCGPAVVAYFREWKNTGRVKELDELKDDLEYQSLASFYDIYDVGEKRAWEFYNKGCRDLNDLVEYMWGDLTHNQQVGLKYVKDFQQPIPRADVEQIGAVVLEHANALIPGFQMVIVGGYRRGKEMSGDVDVILTHPNEDATQDFIDKIVISLYDHNWIAHELVTFHSNSERNQTPLKARGSMPKTAHVGFDTLDKALVVWHNADLIDNPIEGVKNWKRRVDIIITPWKTAGCAILGWSGGKQFEKDLRLYCGSLVPKLKFDSSGIMEGQNWMDYEGDETDLLEKEKLVFKGLGLEWREPTERCTP